MEYTKLGSTGVTVSRICLGTMTFGHNFRNIGILGFNEAFPLVKYAHEQGINFFDTADVYSFGESEEILGKCLKELKEPRGNFVIATKVRGASTQKALEGKEPNAQGLSRKHIIEACNNSLKRLSTDYIDLYQFHGWDYKTPIEESLEAMDYLVRQGKVLYIGVSNWFARHIMKALYISKAKNWPSFVSLQAYYSLVGRDVEHELLPLCKEEGLAFLPWSPLSGGFLTGKYTKDKKPTEGRRTAFDFPPVHEKGYDVVDELIKIANEVGATPAQVAIAWLLHQERVTSVIIGANKMNQLVDNIKSIDIKLSKEHIERLSNIAKPPKLYPEWMVELQNNMRSFDDLKKV